MKTYGKERWRRACAGILVFCILLSMLTGCRASAASRWQRAYELGMKCLSDGNYERAVLAFTAAILIDPNAPEAYIGRGDAYFNQTEAEDHVQLAASDFKTACGLDDGNSDAYLKLANCQSRQGSEEDALETLKNGYRLTKDERLQQKMSEIRQLSGSPDSAKEEVPSDAAGTQQDTVAAAEKAETAATLNCLLSSVWFGDEQSAYFYEFGDGGQMTVRCGGMGGAPLSKMSYTYLVEGNKVTILLKTDSEFIEEPFEWEYSKDKQRFIRTFPPMPENPYYDGSAEILEPFTKKEFYLKLAENCEKADEYIQNLSAPQSEMTQAASDAYGMWDDLLNEIYADLKKSMTADEFASLEAEEEDWVLKKEEAIDKAGQEWSGGSGEPMIRCLAGSYETKERVYELIGMVTDAAVDGTPETISKKELYQAWADNLQTAAAAYESNTPLQDRTEYVYSNYYQGWNKLLDNMMEYFHDTLSRGEQYRLEQMELDWSMKRNAEMKSAGNGKGTAAPTAELLTGIEMTKEHVYERLQWLPD